MTPVSYRLSVSEQGDSRELLQTAVSYAVFAETEVV